MELRLENGLPLVSFVLSCEGKTIHLKDVLFDTGCAATIFDTDLLEEVSLSLDLLNGIPRRMYGIGGQSELCYEQTVTNIQIDSFVLPSFRVQLGMTQEPYGFDGILGIDFIMKVGMIVDFHKLKITFGENRDI